MSLNPVFGGFPLRILSDKTDWHDIFGIIKEWPKEKMLYSAGVRFYPGGGSHPFLRVEIAIFKIAQKSIEKLILSKNYSVKFL